MVTAMVTAMGSRTFRQISNAVGRGLPRVLPLLAGSLAYLALPAIAGDWLIEPRISVTGTATDNVGLNAAKKSDFVTDVTPGLRITGTGGRTSLNVDYQLHEYFYAQDSSRRRHENALNALGNIELVDNWFFLEGSGQISQQSLSAFGGATSTSANSSLGDNSVETSTYRLSPYIRGNFGTVADYQLRYNWATNRSRNNGDSGANVGNLGSDSSEVIGRLYGVTTLTSLGWSLDASSTEYKFRNGVSNEAESLRGVLTYQIDPQFRVSVSGGREANDYLSADKESYTTKGFGFEWSPTERTKIAANREHRFFGPSNSFSFSHRTGGSAWKYVETKDATTLPTQQGSVGLGTYYDLYFNLFSSDPRFAALSPAGKAAFVNGFVQNIGLSPNAQLQGGFLTSGVTLFHRRELSFALLGARNTVTFAATQGESSNLTQGAGSGLLIGSDFANVNKIRQRGASVNWSHQLTPLSTFTGSLSRLNSVGSGAVALETNETMVLLNVFTRVGPKTLAGIGARRVVVDGSTNYTENALTATLSHRF